MSIAEQNLISDERVEEVHGNANFGLASKRAVLRIGVLKCASGYSMGRTATVICQEHGLISDSYSLTPLGRRYLWAAFSAGNDL